MSEYFVYIVRSSSTGKFYTGITDNVIRRLKEHNQHLSNTRTTREIGDFKLVHCECCKDRRRARELEKFFKSGFGREIKDELFRARSSVG